MSCLVNKETLNDFYNNSLLLCFNNSQPALFQNCVLRCGEIISEYKGFFSDDCAQLGLLLWLKNHDIINIKSCVTTMGEVVKEMQKHFDEKYKAPKIFISHSTDDLSVVEGFVTMLEQIGVTQGELFCSSVAGYEIPQGAGDLYDFIRNEMSNDNLFAILMLSKNYYKSPVCLNEMGAAWVKQSEYQSILLPGFQYSKIKGAVDPRDITFRLDDEKKRNYALNDLKDRIIKHLGISDISQNRWERIRNQFLERIDSISKPIS